jgi:MFS family permease
MRKRTWFAICVGLGMVLLLFLAQNNWLLAAIVGMGLGAGVFMFVHAYPGDIAPPADRRHENTLRRRAARQDQR